MMIVVSDTTPIISLLKINRLELLKTLFGRVIMPEAVYEELTSNVFFSSEAEAVNGSVFLEMKQVSDKRAVKIFRNVVGIDKGESEAIALAEELGADLILIDERRGRRVAEQMGIALTGTIGVLLRAFDEKLLSGSEVQACVDGLVRHDIRLNDSLLEIVREHIGRQCGKE